MPTVPIFMLNNSMKITHVAMTPLVGAPGKVSRVLNLAGFNSTSYCFSDYPKKSNLASKFLADTIVVDQNNKYLNDAFLNDIVTSDIIHIHNAITKKQLDAICAVAPDAKFIYQTHSPQKEGPLFYNHADDLEDLVCAKLVVAQYQPRLYPDYIPVPNLVLDTPQLKKRSENETLKVIFSPTHKRGGRWNNKASKVLDKSLDALSNSKKIELVKIDTPVDPRQLMAMRGLCDVSIDEVVTGAYHQVSLEGLCAGNIVLNSADHLSTTMLASMCDGQYPPFQSVKDYDVLECLLKLADDVELTNKKKIESYDFFTNYLNPLVLIQRYIDVYKAI